MALDAALAADLAAAAALVLALEPAPPPTTTTPPPPPPAPPPPSPSPPPPPSPTHDVRAFLKFKVGGLKYNPNLEGGPGWIAPFTQRDRIIANLRANPEIEVTVTFDEATAEQPPPPEGFCVVCRDNKADLLLVPCGHQCVCRTCVSGLKNKCPICRDEFAMAQKVYKSGAV